MLSWFFMYFGCSILFLVVYHKKQYCHSRCADHTQHWCGFMLFYVQQTILFCVEHAKTIKNNVYFQVHMVAIFTWINKSLWLVNCMFLEGSRLPQSDHLCHFVGLVSVFHKFISMSYFLVHWVNENNSSVIQRNRIQQQTDSASQEQL